MRRVTRGQVEGRRRERESEGRRKRGRALSEVLRLLKAHSFVCHVVSSAVIIDTERYRTLFCAVTLFLPLPISPPHLSCLI